MPSSIKFIRSMLRLIRIHEHYVCLWTVKPWLESAPFQEEIKIALSKRQSTMILKPESKLIPFAIFLPEINQSHFWFSIGSVTADFIADRIYELWLKLHKRFPNVDKLVINTDNGPECSGQRTQWLKRSTDLSDKTGLIIEFLHTTANITRLNGYGVFWKTIGAVNCSIPLKRHWDLQEQ